MKLIAPDDHLTHEALNEYLGDALSPFNKQRTERHLLKCVVCYKVLDTLKDNQKPLAKPAKNKLKKAA